MRAVMPGTLKGLVSDVETIVVNSLASWEGREINTFQEMKTVSLISYDYLFLSFFLFLQQSTITDSVSL